MDPVAQSFDSSHPRTAAPFSAAQLKREMREILVATLALAFASLLGLVLIQFWGLDSITTLACQNVLAITSFVVCTYLLYARAEKRIDLSILERSSLFS